MQQMRTVAGPVAARERVEVLDVLRGFALLGILLMNLEGFVGPVMAAAVMRTRRGSASRAPAWR